MRKIEMIGQKYGRLLVREEIGKYVIAACDCGKVKHFWRINVLSGRSKSCGCMQREGSSIANTKHGHTRSPNKTPTYRSWRAMKRRCDNPSGDSWERYGGRNISYNPEWKDFRNFLRDMGERPEGKELDRADNNKDYSKENCRWVYHQANCMNRGY